MNNLEKEKNHVETAHPPGSELKPSDTGFHGWLILATIGVILTPILLVKGIISNYVDWSALFPLNSLQTKILIFVVLNYLVLFPTSLYLLYVYFKKKKSAPLVYMILLGSSFVFMGCDILFSWYLLQFVGPQSVIEIKNAMYSDVVSMIVALIWIAYFWRSKRVKRTFVN